EGVPVGVFRAHGRVADEAEDRLRPDGGNRLAPGDAPLGIKRQEREAALAGLDQLEPAALGAQRDGGAIVARGGTGVSERRGLRLGPAPQLDGAARLPDRDAIGIETIRDRGLERAVVVAVGGAEEGAVLDGERRQLLERAGREDVGDGNRRRVIATGPAGGGDDDEREQGASASHRVPHVLNRKSMMSPSFTVYSLPSARASPCSRAGFQPPTRMKSS